MLFALVSCGPPGRDTPVASYDWLNRNVFQQKCMSCHSSGLASAGISFSTYNSIMNSGLVIPNDPAASPLYLSTRSGTMPKFAAALSNGEEKAIYDWIAAGAPGPDGAGNGPLINTVSPSTGPQSGGTAITLTGTNFLAGALITVGGNACTGITFFSATSMSCITPSGLAGPADVVIKNPNNFSDKLSGAFTYNTTVPSPTLSSISPTSGPTAGGTIVTLSGTYFQSGANVTLDGAACANVKVLSTTTITCTTASDNAGAVDVVVTNPGGLSSTLTGAFTYSTVVLPPTLASISPSSGTTSGGTPVSLHGTNFLSGATVTLDGATCTNVSVVSATTITCTTASDNAGAVNVVVTNPGGLSSTLAGGYTYAVPTVSYANLYSNILGPRCAICHAGSGAPRGISYENYSLTMSTGSVVAGDAANSQLYNSVNSGNMPLSGNSLSSSQIQQIKDWINNGAPNN